MTNVPSEEPIPDAGPPPKPKSMRGFASLTAAQRSQIASLGGQRAQMLGTAHRFSHELAVEAGKKGQAAKQRNAALRAGRRKGT